MPTMSTSRKSKARKAAKSESSAQTGLFILEYYTHQVLIASPRDHDQLQESIRRHFPEIPQGHTVSYWTKSLPICEGELTQVSPDIWDTVIPLVTKLAVQSSPAKRRLGEDGGDRYVFFEADIAGRWV